MGTNEQGALGNPILGPQIAGTEIFRLSTALDWLSIAYGYGGSIAINTKGELWGVGNNSFCDLGNVGQTFVWTKLLPTAGWRQAAMGQFFSWVLSADHTLWSTGYGVAALGLGPDIPTILPLFTQVGSETWTSVACGLGHTLALKADGSLYGCGAGQFGQLGDVSGTQYYLTHCGNNVRTMCGGNNNTFAIHVDGSLFVTGFDYYGTLGRGTTGIQYGFVQESLGLNNWVAVSAGAHHAAALRDDGTLWTTGLNDHGQLGHGDTTNRNLFTKVGTSTDWASVKCGPFHTLALKHNGTMWGWGWNNAGALGFLVGGDSATPTHIAPGTTWISVGDRRSYIGSSWPFDYTHSIVLRAT
jgi:alpha-tubulin suppressor-like RCC1 family protein